MSMCAEEKKPVAVENGDPTMGAGGADDVEVADVVNDAVRRNQNAAHASDAWRKKVRRERRRRKVEAVGGTVLLAAAAAAVLAGMFWEMVHPVFALPLSSVYFMRAAVKIDRYRRGESR